MSISGILQGYSYQMKMLEDEMHTFGCVNYQDKLYTFKYVNLNTALLEEKLVEDVQAGNLPLHQPE